MGDTRFDEAMLERIRTLVREREMSVEVLREALATVAPEYLDALTMEGWGNLLHVADAWRIVREIDLEAIRREATRTFQVLIAAEQLADAEGLGLLLTGESAHHPWLLPFEGAEGRQAARSGLTDLGVLVSRTPELSPELATMREALAGAGVPVVVVVAGHQLRVDGLPRPSETVRVTIPDLVPAALPSIGQALLAATPPAARLALGRQLPALRPALFRQLIDETASANAAYAFTSGLAEVVPLIDIPLNLADIIVLTKNQLMMSYRIALAAGHDGRPRDVMAEVLGVVGAGFLLRQASRSLIGLVPVLGIVPKVAVAWAGTVAVGRAVAAWADGGQAMAAGTLRGVYREALARGREMGRFLIRSRRRPARAS